MKAREVVRGAIGVMSLLAAGCSPAVDGAPASTGPAVPIDGAQGWTWNADEACARSDSTSTVAILTGPKAGIARAALDAAHLYFATGYGTPVIVSFPLPCGKPVVLAQLSSPLVAGLAYSDGELYWLDGEALRALSLDTRKIRTVATRRGDPAAATNPVLAVQAGVAYWADTDGTVSKVSTRGGPVTELASGYDPPGAIAVEGDTVYWSAVAAPVGTGMGLSSLGKVLKIPTTGGDVTTLAIAEENPDSMAVTATAVYWGDAGRFHIDAPSTPGSIMSLGLDAKIPEVFAAGEMAPSELTVAGGALFWVTGAGLSGQGVHERALSQGTVQIIIDDYVPGYTLVASESTLYVLHQIRDDKLVIESRPVAAAP